MNVIIFRKYLGKDGQGLFNRKFAEVQSGVRVVIKATIRGSV